MKKQLTDVFGEFIDTHLCITNQTQRIAEHFPLIFRRHREPLSPTLLHRPLHHLQKQAIVMAKK